MFSAPKDDELFKKWEEALKKCGSVLRKTSFVCEKHFYEQDIRKETVLKDVSGNVLFRVST